MNDPVKVTKEQFWSAIKPLDVHPYPERDRVIWRDRQMFVIAIVTPGYMNEGPETYRIERALVAALAEVGR